MVPEICAHKLFHFSLLWELIPPSRLCRWMGEGQLAAWKLYKRGNLREKRERLLK